MGGIVTLSGRRTPTFGARGAGVLAAGGVAASTSGAVRRMSGDPGPGRGEPRPSVPVRPHLRWRSNVELCKAGRVALSGGIQVTSNVHEHFTRMYESGPGTRGETSVRPVALRNEDTRRPLSADLRQKAERRGAAIMTFRVPPATYRRHRSRLGS